MSNPRLSNQRVDPDRLWDTLMHSARFGATAAGGLRRLALSDEDAQVRRWFIDQCAALGADIAIDAMGNIFATMPGGDPGLAPIAIGSHLDTQPTGGKFDGILGVLAGLEVARSLADHAAGLRHPLTLINWTNEEGARFAPAMTGSCVFAGIIPLARGLACTDCDGITLGQALARLDMPAQGTPPRQLAACFELHIEQGPILEAEGTEIGIVTGVQGIAWFTAAVIGTPCHAGTTPMTMRHDPLRAAAAMVQAIAAIAEAEAPQGRATVGRFEVRPGSINTVPQEVGFSIDMRHPDGARLAAMEQALEAALRAHAVAQGCALELTPIWHADPVMFDPACLDLLRSEAAALGLRARDMVSGAGHDAAHVARVAPTAMIFVPCLGGLSHNEAESITPAQAADGANLLLHAVLARDRIDL